MQTESFTICSLCTRKITNNSGRRICNVCHKWTHCACDTDTVGTGAVEGEYVCPSCRDSPLVADAMMTSAGGRSLATSPTSVSAQDETSRLAVLESGYCVQSPANHSSPLVALGHLDSAFNDMFSLPQGAGHGDVSTSSSPATTTATTTASNSARASPSLYAENTQSSDVDDFRPPIRRERSESYIGRSFRGSGGRKPSSGRMFHLKIRSVGSMMQSSENLEHVSRGKRYGVGSRGGNKSGKGTRGRRPRGGKTSSMLAMVSAASQVRECEVEDSECEEIKHRNEENDYIRTAVVTSADNAFFSQMSLCLICGSIGKDVEGTMVTCASCAQSYHTFCVGLHEKLNSTIVKHGWRCLDCTVCEGCGEGRDESNLLLCDECDVSYHTYCLDPPLERIPSGPWWCKWCATCLRCCKPVPNFLDLQRMDGLCETCHTLRKCPKCFRSYEIGENIIKCQHCSKWLHGKCEDLFGEDMLEAAAENGFRCSLCRPQGNLQLNDALSLLICDNVAMNKSALDVMHSRLGGSLFRSSSTMEPFESPLHHIGSRSHSLDDMYEDEEMDLLASSMNCRMRSVRGGNSGRRILKLGVGGFVVKIPRHRLLVVEDEASVEEEMSPSQKPKMKRPRKPRRSQLEDNYPPIIQESFFGVRPIEGRNLLEMVIAEPNLQYEYKKTSIKHEKCKEVSELNEESSEALREGESILGDITENEIFGNMEEIDFDNFDINELLLDGDDDDDEDTLDGNAGDTCNSSHGEKGQTTASCQPDCRSPFAFLTGIHQNTKSGDGVGSMDPNSRCVYPQRMPGIPASFPLQGGLQAQAGSRASSQMGESVCIERVNQATERWEEDEPLGERATKAAVLYANINYPQWKQEFPEWCERVKHIHRMWRSLDANSRQDYVNRARENRATRSKPKAKRLVAAGMRSGFNSPKSSPSPASIANAPFYYVPDGEGGLTPALIPSSSLGTVFTSQTPMVPLSKEVMDNYALLQRRSNELAKYQQAIENDLARMRKQKKNLTAKRRQLNKNNQQVDEAGQRVDVELNEADRFSLASLINAIPIRQNDLENCKRDIKQHCSNVRDFEVKNNIPSDMFAQPSPSIQQSLSQAPAIRVPGSHLHVPYQQQILCPPCTSDVRPPPPYSMDGANIEFSDSAAFASRISQYQPTNVNTLHQPPFVSPSRDIEQTNDSGPPTPSSGRPGSSTSSEWQNKMKFGRKRKRENANTDDYHRPVSLGGVLFSNLTTELDMDVYDVCDHLLTQVVIMIDGAEAARKSGMLKRLLDAQPGKPYRSERAPFSAFNMPGGIMTDASSISRHSEIPKPKKKRSQPKKAAAITSNEYDLLLERITTQLRLCPPLPRRALEPIPRIDRSSFTIFGITDLPDRIDKPSILGDELGNLRLVFMRDYYTRLFECPVDEQSLYPSMNAFCGELNAASLYEDLEEFASIAWANDCESSNILSPMKSLSLTRRSRSPTIYLLSRPSDTVAPQPPHRSAFLKKAELTKQYTVSLVMDDCSEEYDPVISFQQLMTLLDIEKHPEYEIDTPPSTPENAAPESNETTCLGEKLSQDEMLVCRQCDGFMREAAINKTMSELGLTPSQDKNNDVSFCSMRCYYIFVANCQVALSPDDVMKAEQFVDEATVMRLRQISADHFAKYLHLGKVKSEFTNSQFKGDYGHSPLESHSSIYDNELQAREQIIHVKELSLMNECSIQKTAEKKWRGHLWVQCDIGLIESYQRLTNQVRQKHMAIQLQSAERVKGIMRSDDSRVCALCMNKGDGDVELCGRLLNVDANVWVHVNCAIWSQEVYESPTGALHNVGDAIRRVASVTCSFCGLTGASIRCYKLNCESHFHLPCARMARGYFLKDRTFICASHDDVRFDMCISRLDSLRRLYIDREENLLIARLFQHSDAGRLLLRVGSLIFHHIGQLLPEQLKEFHNSDYIFPIGYSVTRLFYSPFNVHERLRYDCSICDNKSKAEFVITYEGGKEIREISSTSAWSRILSGVESCREKVGGLIRMFPKQLSGETLFGLNESAISKMTESLPGVDQLVTYTFKHGGIPLMDLPLAVNPSGCARCEPRFRTLIKHKHRCTPPSPASIKKSNNTDPLSRHSRTRSGGTLSSIDPGVRAILQASGISPDLLSLTSYSRWEPGQLTSSNYSQYQKMRKEWKSNVYLARSKIQGLGLYATRDIEMNAMIIEYKGEVIRSEVGEMREKKYEAQNRGVYMFRIDEERLIDATMAGGPARYINHSCDPNCSTKLVASGPNGEDKKIIIIANRPISAGEELTYDYQFDIEDTADKIECLCGAPNCQKWMN